MQIIPQHSKKRGRRSKREELEPRAEQIKGNNEIWRKMSFVEAPSTISRLFVALQMTMKLETKEQKQKLNTLTPQTINERFFFIFGLSEKQGAKNEKLLQSQPKKICKPINGKRIRKWTKENVYLIEAKAWNILLICVLDEVVIIQSNIRYLLECLCSRIAFFFF